MSPHSARSDLAELLNAGIRVVTVCGRYYAMDRDERWDRTHRALGAIVDGEGIPAGDAVAAIVAFAIARMEWGRMRAGKTVGGVT